MKIIAILILVIPILANDYDLSKGEEKNITNLKSGIPYYLFLPSIQFESAFINLNISYMTTEPFTYIHIYEYETRNSSNYLERSSQPLSTITKDNELTSSFTYLVNNYKTKYIALQFTPNYNINYIVVKINVEGVYDLSNGEDKNITNLKVDIPYYFFLPSIYLQTALININMSYINTTFIIFYIYEYESRYSETYLKFSGKYLRSTKKNNEFILSFTYLVSNVNTKFIALKFTPDYNLNYTSLNSIVDGFYDLSNGVDKNITNLKSEIPYYFFLPSIQLQTLSINLNMSYMSTKPFNYTYIYEYENKYSYKYLKGSTQSLSTTTKNDILISSFRYSVDNYKTKYIALKLILNDNINYIVVNINADGVYDLSNGEDKNITNLKSGIPYYFFLPSIYLQTASINLNMNFTNTKPFTYLYIYEYGSRYSSTYIKNTSQPLSTITKNNELSSSFTYSVNNDQTKYIALQFTPNYNINYIVIKINLEGVYDLSNGKDKNIQNLKAGIPYYFFLPSIYLQTAFINLNISYMSNEPFTYIYIYEYKTRNSPSYLKRSSQSLSTTIKNKELTSSFTYSSNNVDTKYIALQFTPNYNINYIVVKISVEGVYEFFNVEEKNITNLKSGIPYFFFLSINQFQSAFINLNMNYMNTKPFTSSEIYEYSSRYSSTYLKYTSMPLSTTKKNSELTSSFIYSVNNDETEYIALKFTPNYNINYIVVNIKVDGVYNFFNNDVKTITNLQTGISYYFFFPSIYFQTVLINVNMSYVSTEPFKDLEIYEYSIKYSSYYLQRSSQSLSTITKELKLTYLVNNHNTKYIALKFEPNYNINKIVVNFNAIDGVYDLSNDIAKNITNLKTGVYYYFFLPSIHLQTASINLNMNYMNTKPFTYLYIYEYESKYSSSYQGNPQYFSPITKNNELTSSFTYLVNNYKTNYFVLHFKPDCDINYIVVKINVEGLFSLSNGVNKNITNLKSGIPYYFFLSSFQLQMLFINLNMSYMGTDMSTVPFTYSYIYEYANRYFSKSLKYTSQSLSTTIKNNELKSSFTYLVNNSNTKYIVLTFTPKYNLNYIAVNINAEGGGYDLSNGEEKNITNLKSGISYFFFLPINQFQSAFINFNMSYMSSEPFTYLYIYEYSSRSPSSYIKNSSQSFSTTIKNNELTSSFTYLVNYYNTKYIALNFTPNYNLNYIIGKIDIKNHTYKLSYNGEKQTIYNLNSQNKYYLLIKMNNKREIKVTLTMNYDYSNPLSFLYIYELKDYYDGLDSYSNKENKSITIDNKNSQSIISFTYTTSNSNIEYLVLEITPNYDITSMESEFEYISSLSTGMIILIIFICLFVFIIIIICIIKIRRKHSKNSNILENPKIQPLYPNNEPPNNQKKNASQQQLYDLP